MTILAKADADALAKLSLSTTKTVWKAYYAVDIFEGKHKAIICL